jgi:hypothetical protein
MTKNQKNIYIERNEKSLRRPSMIMQSYVCISPFVFWYKGVFCCDVFLACECVKLCVRDGLKVSKKKEKKSLQNQKNPEKARSLEHDPKKSNQAQEK